MPVLQWLTRNEDLKTAKKAAYRLLRELPELGAGDKDSGNMVVQGDNLEALKALLPFYAGQVKCIYIDPPYNTGSAFEHYDDNLEHTIWLSMMYPRLELLKQFLREDGAIFIQLDDNEQAYTKVVCDEIFGRNNFITNIVWQKRTSPDNRLRLGSAQDYILVYTKKEGGDKKFNQSRIKDFKNPDNDPRGPWASTDCTAQAGHGTKEQFYVL
ncbi:MAG: site-specific DNA-methyltransferase, partial [Zoogloeaceae bacterium]|nr:site-specific DNA-methyltransferase [Zoogloeaceae bacterium]